MKKTFTISIPKPCHEKWEEFKPTTLGGFCSSCQKEVIDFTTWDEDRIKAYFTNRSQTSCGRFYPEQLKSYTLQETSKFNFLRWTYVPLISLVMLLFSRNAQAQKIDKTRIEKPITKGEALPVIGDTVHIKVIKGVVTSFEDQSVIPGVNILLKGTTVGTATGADGKFSLSIPGSSYSDTLVFSFIGLKTIERSFKEQGELSVSMRLDDTPIENVAVIAGMLGGYEVESRGLRKTWRGFKNLFREK